MKEEISQIKLQHKEKKNQLKEQNEKYIQIWQNKLKEKEKEIDEI